MSSLTTEQIFLLIIFVGIPLARFVLRHLRQLRPQRPATVSPVEREETDQLEEEDAPFPAPARPGESSRSAAKKPPPGLAPATASRAHRRRGSSPPLVAIRRQNAAASARAVIRGGNPGLHQAVALMTIIGPPRTLDPYPTHTRS